MHHTNPFCNGVLNLQKIYLRIPWCSEDCRNHLSSSASPVLGCQHIRRQPLFLAVFCRLLIHMFEGAWPLIDILRSLAPECYVGCSIVLCTKGLPAKWRQKQLKNIKKVMHQVVVSFSSVCKDILPCSVFCLAVLKPCLFSPPLPSPL